MSENFDIEAARKLVADIGLRPAARHYGMNHATLYSRIRSDDAKKVPAPARQETPKSEQLEPEPEAEPWRTIRRHEDHTRKLFGLPPLTDAEWATTKHKMEECNRAMAHFWEQQ